MSEVGELRVEAAKALLTKITKAAEAHETPLALLMLAEAFAWTVNPNEPHGASAAVPKT